VVKRLLMLKQLLLLFLWRRLLGGVWESRQGLRLQLLSLLYTNRGIVGIGETYGGRGTVEAINVAKPLFIGSDPFELGRLIDKFQGGRLRGLG